MPNLGWHLLQPWKTLLSKDQIRSRFATILRPMDPRATLQDFLADYRPVVFSKKNFFLKFFWNHKKVTSIRLWQKLFRSLGFISQKLSSKWIFDHFCALCVPVSLAILQASSIWSLKRIRLQSTSFSELWMARIRDRQRLILSNLWSKGEVEFFGTFLELFRRKLFFIFYLENGDR